ncbi:MAG: aldo/keto reductase [Nitriliruptorales bacterium]|nr:aldo/keto reductase [Nitriliruptorales bacterium]
MLSLRLGTDGPVLPRMGLGCMSMSHPGRDRAESLRTLQTAIDRGVNFLDTADKYGKGDNERLVAEAIRGRHDDVVVATKVGFVGSSRDPRPIDGSPRHIHTAARRSLERLEVETIDLLYLHRVDPAVPIEESVGALAELVAGGIVRHVGLSEAGPNTLRRAHAVHPIAALQSEYSLWTREPEAEVLGVCRDLGTTFVAYSPLGIGFLTGTVRDRDDLPEGNRLAKGPRVEPGNLEHNLTLVEQLAAVAERVGCTPAQLALAWLMARDVVPIPGSARVEHLLENVAALEVQLGDEDLSEIDRIAPPGAAAGTRKSQEGLSLTGR